MASRTPHDSTDTHSPTAALDGQPAPSGSTPTFDHVDQRLWGVGLHMGGIHHEVESLRATLADLGVNSSRVDLHWSNFERTRNQFEWPESRSNLKTMLAEVDAWGVRPLGILNYDNPLYFVGLPESQTDRASFNRYVEAVVRRHGSSVAAFELWNEWNIGGGTQPRRSGTATAYVELLEQVRAVTRREAPGVPLIAGAVANRDMAWIRRFVSLGGVALCDGLSVHPYNFADRDPSAEEVVQWLDSLNEALNGDGNKPIPIYMTEIGWPNHRGEGGTDEQVTAQRLLKLMLLVASRSYIGGVWWYDLVDDGTDPHNKEFHFGLVRRDGSRKPAFFAYQLFLRHFKGARFINSLHRDGDTALEFIDVQGRRLVAAWSAEGTSRMRATVTGHWELLPVSAADARATAELEATRSFELGAWPVILVLSKDSQLRLTRLPRPQ